MFVYLIICIKCNVHFNLFINLTPNCHHRKKSTQIIVLHNLENKENKIFTFLQTFIPLTFYNRLTHFECIEILTVLNIDVHLQNQVLIHALYLNVFFFLKVFHSFHNFDKCTILQCLTRTKMCTHGLNFDSKTKRDHVKKNPMSTSSISLNTIMGFNSKIYGNNNSGSKGLKKMIIINVHS